MEVLPYNRQSISEEDIAAVIDALKSPYLTTGPIANLFEEKLAEYTGAKYAVVCSNGTTALHMTMQVLGIGPGDAIVTSPITFLSDANAARFQGADVLFADIDPETVNLDPRKVREILRENKSVKAIIPVHFAGRPVALEAFYEIGKEFNVHIIEDACHALGGEYYSTQKQKTLKIGSCDFSTMSVFSFHPIKNITTGEGGAVLTNDEELYKKLLAFRKHGTINEEKEIVNRDLGISVVDGQEVVNPWYYEMQYLANNYRICDFQCALGISQLSRIDSFIEKRNNLAKMYRDSLTQYSQWITPLKETEEGLHAYHLFSVRINFESLKGGRAALMHALYKKGVQTQVHYIPIYLQPYYQSYFGKRLKLEHSDAWYDQCLSLPLFISMTQKDVDYVVECLIQAISSLRKT